MCDLERALSLATTTKSTGHRVRAQMALSSVIATEGKLSEAETMASAAVQDALAAGLDTAAAEGLLDLAATFDDKGEYDKAGVEAERAVKIATERGARRTLARARLQLAEVRRLQLKPEEALKIVEEVLPFVRKNNYRRFELFGLLIEARAHDQLGQLEQARQMSAAVLAMADSLHDQARAALAAALLAKVNTSLGNLHEALPLRERAEAIYRQTGDQGALPYALASNADLLIRLGRLDAANRVLSELEAGIAKRLEAYVGRARRASFLRGFAAAAALRCDDAARTLADRDRRTRRDRFDLDSDAGHHGVLRRQPGSTNGATSRPFRRRPLRRRRRAPVLAGDGGGRSWRLQSDWSRRE